MVADRELLSKFAVGALMVLSFTYGWTTSYPDNVYISYGFPLRWGTFQMVTIAGRVDVWRVDVTALFIDLVLWVVLLILVPMLLKPEKINPTKSPEKGERLDK